MYLFVYVYVYILVCLFVYVYVYIFINEKNAGLLGIRSVWYRNEKKLTILDRVQCQTRRQSAKFWSHTGTCLKNYGCQNAHAGVSFLDADALPWFQQYLSFVEAKVLAQN